MTDDPDYDEALLKQYPYIELSDICKRIELRLSEIERRVGVLENQFIKRWPA